MGERNVNKVRNANTWFYAGKGVTRVVFKGQEVLAAAAADFSQQRGAS
jgi:hypothetical protein